MRILSSAFLVLVLAAGGFAATPTSTPTATATATATATPTATLTLAQIKTKVDNKLAVVWATAQPKEDAYRLSHGRYWQGLFWCVNPPADGADTLPDSYSTHPSYEAANETWLDEFPALSGAVQPYCLAIHVYDGPNGQGYVGCIRGESQGNIYTRCQQVGNEVWRTFGWTQETAGP